MSLQPSTPSRRAGRTAARGRGRDPRPAPLLIALVVVIIVAAVVIRAVTLTPPRVHTRVGVATTVRLPGTAPVMRWPTAGEAAFAVQGVGSLGSAGGDAPVPIASVAKVMTAYLVLAHDPLRGSGSGFTVTITPAQAAAESLDARQGDSVVPVAAGERLTERQLLEALLVYSGDNIARLLAARDAGSVTRFVGEMNAEAHTLGMDHTTYTDPSGLAASTVSDASDQLRLFTRAMRDPVLRRIVSEPSVTLPVAGTVRNYDPLIADGYDGKTGSDSSAEGCLAFDKRVTVGGRSVTTVGVVLGQGTGSDTAVILDAAADAAQDLVGSVTSALRVDTVLHPRAGVLVATGADHHRVDGLADGRLSVIGWGGLRERLTVGTRRLGTGVHTGEPLGTVTLGGGLPTPAGVGSRTTVRASARLARPGLGWRLAHLL